MVDAGDVPGDATDGPGNSAQTTAAVAAILERGAVPICIGGDDSVPIAILRAYEGRGPLTILQVDAHLDFRDEIDGVREGYSSPMRRASEMPQVWRIVHVGLRGVGSAWASDVDDSRAAGNLLVTARASCATEASRGCSGRCQRMHRSLWRSTATGWIHRSFRLSPPWRRAG